MTALTPVVLARLVELVVEILRERGLELADARFALELARYLHALAGRYERGETLEQLAEAPLAWARDLDAQELELRVRLLGEARQGDEA